MNAIRMGTMKRITAGTIILILLTVLIGATQQADLSDIQSPVVQIAAFYLDEVKINYTTGSGSVIHPEGVILTNFHVIFDQESKQMADLLFILVTEQIGDPPMPQFVATFLLGDPKLDLALIRAHELLNGNGVNDLNDLINTVVRGSVSTIGLPSELNLPFLRLGDSDSVYLEDNVILRGYPTSSLGLPVLTATTGIISAIRNDWGYFLIDVETYPGDSGGALIDSDDCLIGVPVGVERTEETGEEVCQPPLTLARPINLAKPLIDPVFEGLSPVPSCQ